MQLSFVFIFTEGVLMQVYKNFDVSKMTVKELYKAIDYAADVGFFRLYSAAKKELKKREKND